MELSEIRKAAARLKEGIKDWWNIVYCDWDKFKYSTKAEWIEERNKWLLEIAKAIRAELLTLSDWVTNLDGNTQRPMTRLVLNNIVELLKDVEMITKDPYFNEIPDSKDRTIKRIVEWSGMLLLSQQITMMLNVYEYRAVADTLPQTTEEATDQTTGTPQPTRAPQQITDEAKEIVKPYFTAAFKGIGKENDTNYFELLIADLIRRKTAKEKATILLLAFESKEVNTKRPNSFAEWLRIWGNILGCKLDYKQNKLDISTVVGQCYYLHLKGGQTPK